MMKKKNLEHLNFTIRQKTFACDDTPIVTIELNIFAFQLVERIYTTIPTWKVKILFRNKCITSDIFYIFIIIK